MHDSDVTKEIDRMVENKKTKDIVLECIEVLRKRYMGDNNREDMEVLRCIEDVKRHFGIDI